MRGGKLGPAVGASHGLEPGVPISAPPPHFFKDYLVKHGDQMSWNYRIIREVEGKTTQYYRYVIKCVYEDAAGKIDRFCIEPSWPVGLSVSELEGNISMMNLAFKKPVLEEKDGDLVEIT
jgi:hypothetical protein